MTEPEPSLRPTSAATLFVAGLGAAALTWVLIGEYYGDLPRLTWLPAATLGLLALAEAYAAWNTRTRIARRPGTTPVEPLTVARLVVLAKASALVAAIFTGAYGATSIWLAIPGERLKEAGNDLPPAVLGLVASVLLLAAALWLEHSGRIPPASEEIDEKPSAG